MRTSDSLFDPAVYSTNSTMAEADTQGSGTTDSSYDKLSDLLEAGGTGPSVTNTKTTRVSEDHKSSPSGKLSPCEDDKSTTEQLGHTNEENTSELTETQTNAVQANSHIETLHQTHNNDRTKQEDERVRNRRIIQVVGSVLVLLIAIKGNIWVKLVTLFVLLYGVKVLRRAQDDVAEGHGDDS